MEIPILFEDEHLLVIDKPVGISVAEDDGQPLHNGSMTVKEWVKERYGYITSHNGAEDEFEQRYGIVHRLDKDTSGVLLIAKDKEVFQYLKGLFKFRRIEKEYQVLVYGRVEDTRFEVSAPISRNTKTGTSYTLDESGRESTTLFTTIRHVTFNLPQQEKLETTYLNAYPKTGRTHQIRVHLRALGHPVVNDLKYANRTLIKASEGLFDRMMLHARKITFVDWDGKNREFISNQVFTKIF